MVEVTVKVTDTITDAKGRRLVTFTITLFGKTYTARLYVGDSISFPFATKRCV